jgi:hypothetical protein
MTAQVVTLTESENRYPIRKIKWDWLSTDTGVVSSATLQQYTGAIVKVIFKSDTGGTQPTDAYDVTILDSDGFDVLNGEGANVNRAAPVIKTNLDQSMFVMGTTLTLTIAAAGDAKGGEVYLYIVPWD